MFSVLGQWAFDLLVGTTKSGFIHRVARELARHLRRVLVARGDPEIRYPFGAGTLILPLSHQLPFYVRDHPDYGRSVARIASTVSQQSPRMCFIDIGANVGDTVSLLRELAHFPILCVEPQEQFRALLSRNVRTWPDVVVTGAFLDSVRGSTTGEMASGAGSARWVMGAAKETRSALTLSDLLHDFPAFQRPRMIKVDTDGMDARILSGAMSVIEESKPVLYFEYDPGLAAEAGADLPGLMRHLAALGYEHAIVYENIGTYLYSARLGDPIAVEDLEAGFSDRPGRRYADICVFHRGDAALAGVVRRQELERLRPG